MFCIVSYQKIKHQCITSTLDTVLTKRKSSFYDVILLPACFLKGPIDHSPFYLLLQVTMRFVIVLINEHDDDDDNYDDDDDDDDSPCMIF